MTVYYKSKAVRLAEELLKDIWHNRYPIDGYLPTEEELAKRYGSSRMTIRKVLRLLEDDRVLVKIPNCGTRINPELNLPTQPVAAAAEPVAIGAVFTAFPDTLTIEVNRGIRDYAIEHGMSFRLIQNTEGPEELLRELWKFQRLKLSGVVWFDNSACMGKVLQHLAGQHFPIVCVDNPPQHVDVPYVGVDNFGGMYAAATALLKTFRDGISYFGRELTLESRMRRYEGYCQAMKDFGLEARIAEYTSLFREMPSRGGWFVPEQDLRIAEAAEQLLLSRPRPFGMVTENDYVARVVLDTAGRLHLRCGSDFYLCGFDDLPLAETLQLSSVHQPRYELGYEAARQLAMMIEDPSFPGMSSLLPVTLVERASTDVSHLENPELPLEVQRPPLPASPAGESYERRSCHV